MSARLFSRTVEWRACPKRQVAARAQMELNRANIIFSCSPSAIMGFRKISDDLKQVALRMHLDRGWVPDDVAETLGFSERSLYRWKERFLTTGDLHILQHPEHGRPRLIPPPATRDLLELIQDAPQMYLDEIQEWLDIAQDVQISRSALHDNLRDCGLTYKAIHKCAAERNEPLREQFRQYAQANWVAEQLVFVDETSKDDRVIYRHFGRSLSGSQATIHQPFKCGQRYSIIAALGLDGYINQQVVENSAIGEIFTDFIKNEVVRNLLYILQ